MLAAGNCVLWLRVVACWVSLFVVGCCSFVVVVLVVCCCVLLFAVVVSYVLVLLMLFVVVGDVCRCVSFGDCCWLVLLFVAA